MEAFVRLRELLSSNRELAKKLAELERRVAKGERGEPLEDVVRRLRLAEPVFTPRILKGASRELDRLDHAAARRVRLYPTKNRSAHVTANRG